MLHTAAIALYVAISLYVGVLAAYMLAIVAGAWLYRPHAATEESSPKIAVIMPAYNEEPGIAAAVSSVLRADYHDEKLHVFVLADNCTDRTADIAESLGANVWVRADESNRGKGQALDWALRTKADVLQAYDLIAFIDADMEVDLQFFRTVSRYFEMPENQVLQGRYTMSATDPNWLRAMAFASFAYVNHIRPAGRCYWGGSAGLKGGGMVFRRDLIVGLGWPAQSITEDLELGARLLEQGISVTYAPDAVVTSAVPVSRSAVHVQQVRWESGRMEFLKLHGLLLLRQVVSTPSASSVEALLDAIVPPLSVVVLLCLIGVASGALLDVPLWVFLICLATFATAVLSGLVQLKAPLSLWLKLFSAPIFFVWKLSMLWSVAVRRRVVVWSRTPRAK